MPLFPTQVVGVQKRLPAYLHETKSLTGKRLIPPFIAKQPDGPIPDHYSAHGAETLAKRLEAIWHIHGWPKAQFWAKTVSTNGRGSFLVVSNLVNGLPPI